MESQVNFTELIGEYFQALNELDEKCRLDLIQKIWASDGMFVSPVGKAQNHQANSDLIGGFHQHSPGTTIRQVGEIEVLHQDYLRFGFEAITADGEIHASGVDFAVIKDCKLQLVAGFFDSRDLRQQEIINTVKQVYQAFNAGDIARWFTFLAPTFEWHAADNSPIADHSPYVGLDAVRTEVIPRLGALFPGMQLRIDEILANENKAIMLGYYYNLPGGAEAQVSHILTFEGEKIIKFQQYLDSYKFANL
jgi:ketosteroid isomerase-like protein